MLLGTINDYGLGLPCLPRVVLAIVKISTGPKNQGLEMNAFSDQCLIRVISDLDQVTYTLLDSVFLSREWG